MICMRRFCLKIAELLDCLRFVFALKVKISNNFSFFFAAANCPSFWNARDSHPRASFVFYLSTYQFITDEHEANMFFGVRLFCYETEEFLFPFVVCTIGDPMKGILMHDSLRTKCTI